MGLTQYSNIPALEEQHRPNQELIVCTDEGELDFALQERFGPDGVPGNIDLLVIYTGVPTAESYIRKHGLKAYHEMMENHRRGQLV